MCGVMYRVMCHKAGWWGVPTSPGVPAAGDVGFYTGGGRKNLCSILGKQSQICKLPADVLGFCVYALYTQKSNLRMPLRPIYGEGGKSRFWGLLLRCCCPQTLMLCTCKLLAAAAGNWYGF